MTLAAVLGLACDLPETKVIPAEPGSASLEMSDRWIQGEPTDINLRWRNAGYCAPEDWFCRDAAAPMTVLSATCHNCTILADPTGQTTYTNLIATAIASSDEPLSFDVTMRFDATGDVASLTGHATGDHEVAVEARCALVDQAQATAYIAPDLIHDCGDTRLASEAILIVPAIRTFHGATRFPFCFESSPCLGRYYYGEHYRPGTMAITPVPRLWGDSTAFSTFWFAVLPADTTAPTAEVRVTLASGEIAATSVALPPVQ